MKKPVKASFTENASNKNSIQTTIYFIQLLDFLYHQRLGNKLGLLTHQIFFLTFSLQEIPSSILNSGRNVCCEGALVGMTSW